MRLHRYAKRPRYCFLLGFYAKQLLDNDHIYFLILMSRVNATWSVTVSVSSSILSMTKTNNFVNFDTELMLNFIGEKYILVPGLNLCGGHGPHTSSTHVNMLICGQSILI